MEKCKKAEDDFTALKLLLRDKEKELANAIAEVCTPDSSITPFV